MLFRRVRKHDAILVKKSVRIVRCSEWYDVSPNLRFVDGANCLGIAREILSNCDNLFGSNLDHIPSSILLGGDCHQMLSCLGHYTHRIVLRINVQLKLFELEYFLECYPG